MSYENVKLWFAKNQNEQIITIDEIKEDNRNDTYLCPVCGSNLKPKAVKSKQVTSHFAHIDASKCNSESQIHFWFKHKFLEEGDKFTVAADEVRNYICKEILVEEPCKTEYGIYKPDVTILTECGKIVYFEMAFTNKKKVKDYLDMWLELKNIVVEVDIKQLMNKDEISTFKSLFYEGKCFNVKRNDTYYNTIGKYKEEKLKGKVNNKLKERIRKLDWFWDDVFRYKKSEVDIEYISMVIDNIDKEEKEIVLTILNKNKCKDLYEEYLNHKLNKVFENVISYLEEHLGKECLIYLDTSLIDYGKYYKSNITMERYFWVNRCRSSYKIGEKGVSRSWYNIEQYTQNELNEIILKDMELNLQYIKGDIEIEKYKNSVKYTIENLKNSELYLEMVNEIKNRHEGYELEIVIIDEYVDPINVIENKISLNKLSFKLKLKFNNKYIQIDPIRVDTYIEAINVEGICNLVKHNFNEYVNKLDSLKIVEELNYLTDELQSKFFDYNTNVTSQLIFEDIYLISARTNNRHFEEGVFKRTTITGDSIGSYYISNEGILADYHHQKELKFKSKKINEIKEYLICDIENNLKESTKFKCFECGVTSTLELGEMKFFIKKELRFPKRCKCCRNERKQNK